MFTSYSILIATLGGIVPALIWLFFWLREDEHQEPRKIILLTFLFGMLCVPLVLPFQYFVSKYIGGGAEPSTLIGINFLLALFIIFLWASVEEILKYIASHLLFLQRKEIDEPMDWVIYMISTALGFSAAENALFLISPLLEGNISLSIATGNLRFIGATLLHVLCSAVVGIFLAFAFYKSKHIKTMYRSLGILTAIFLHTAFNLFIITDEHSTMTVFSFVWIATIILILLLEKIKKLKPVIPKKIPDINGS
ncbi:MAG: PrsW family glutamic-type intramembrane protease [bacterium]